MKIITKLKKDAKPLRIIEYQKAISTHTDKFLDVVESFDLEN